MKNLFILFVTFFICSTTIASTKADSLNQNWENSSLSDSTRCSSIYDLIWSEYLYNNPDTAFKLARNLYFFAQKNRLVKWEYRAIRLQGLSSLYTDRYRNAQRYFKMYLDYHLKNQNLAEVGEILHVIGMTNVNQGDLAKGLEYYKKSLKIVTELKDTSSIGATLNNIGNIYYELEDLDRCLDYYQRSLEYKKKTNNQRAIANSLNNIGLILHEQGHLDSALLYYEKSLKIHIEIDNQPGQILAFTNIGALHEERGHLDDALKFFKTSLNMAFKLKNYTEVSNSYSNISEIFIAKNQLDSALNNSLQGLQIARDIESVNFIEHATENLYEIYKEKGNDKLALEMYEEHILMRDSLKSEATKKGLLEMEVKYEIEKEEIEEEHRQKEMDLAATEKQERRNSLEYSGITFAIFVLFGLLFFLGKFHLPNWLLELSVFLPFLLLFEFLLVLFDPFVESYASGDPMVKLLINAVLAGMIFPLHSFFERFLKKRLFKAN
ncbi:MAG: tetratricopeptide repeat protein [Salibacteraceae bacterium]